MFNFLKYVGKTKQVSSSSGYDEPGHLSQVMTERPRETGVKRKKLQMVWGDMILVILNNL